jgi:hypothetical protein
MRSGVPKRATGGQQSPKSFVKRPKTTTHKFVGLPFVAAHFSRKIVSELTLPAELSFSAAC